MIHSNLLELVGRTPLVRMRRINPAPSVGLLAKIEAKSIGGSIKDRVALAMIEAAEASGELTPDKTVIEATSGNTGIGLAMVCAVKGYKLMLLMPESASEERKRIMRAYGATLRLTPGHMGTDGAIEEAYRLAREHPETYVLMDQFNNPASIAAHYHGTAREIWEDTDGRVTHVVATLGTTGTAMGLCKRLREFNPAIRIIAVEPRPGHRIQGLKNMQESYPPGIWDKHVPDEVAGVADDEAFAMARRMAREEGLLVGMSSGAAAAVAARLAESLAREGKAESLVVFICPDSGERYLSTTLFAPAERTGPTLFDVSSGTAQVLPAGQGGFGVFTPGPSLDALFDAESWRRIVTADALCRAVAARGGKATAVVPLADMDDRALSAARQAGLSRAAFAEESLGRVREQAARLGVGEQVRFVLASASMERALALTTALLGRGLAYEKLRSVYFDVTRERDYGRTAHADTTGLKIGHTVDLAAYAKDNPLDFTLLKRASLADLKAGEVLDTQWGKVRPSWFLQLAAAAVENLPSVDVVLAAEAHRFPHLENFAAIFGRAAGMRPSVWAVAGPVCGREECGETSQGLPELPDEADPHDLRVWLLSTSYRKTLTTAPQGLSMWRRNRGKAQDLYAALHLAAQSPGKGAASGVPGDVDDEAAALRTAFSAAMEDDLSLHRFWPAFSAFIKAVNGRLAAGGIGAGAERALAALDEVDAVLGILDREAVPLAEGTWSPEVRAIVREREEARATKDFVRADGLRARLCDHGFRLEDTPLGPRLFRANARQSG